MRERQAGGRQDGPQVAEHLLGLPGDVAVDELSGFISAVALVRPDGIRGMTPKSVKKKMKQSSFAAAVDREQLRRSAEELGVDFDEHVARVIAAMEERAAELGLEGRRE